MLRTFLCVLTRLSFVATVFHISKYLGNRDSTPSIRYLTNVWLPSSSRRHPTPQSSILTTNFTWGACKIASPISHHHHNHLHLKSFLVLVTKTSKHPFSCAAISLSKVIERATYEHTIKSPLSDRCWVTMKDGTQSMEQITEKDVVPVPLDHHVLQGC